MQKQTLLLLVFIIISAALSSQTYTANITTTSVNRNVQPAISVVSEADVRGLQKSWEKHLKKQYKGKASSRRNTVTASAIVIPSISAQPVNIYAFFNNHRDGSELIAAVEMSEGSFVSQTNYSQEFQALKTMTETFVRDYCREKLSGLIKEKQKNLRKQKKLEAKLNKTNKKLERLIERSNRSIQQNQRRIEQSNAEIKENTGTIRDLRKTIDAQSNEIRQLERRKSNF